MLKTTCRCGKSYQFKDEYAGRKFTCKACQKSMVIGAKATVPEKEEEESEDRLPPPKLRTVKSPASASKKKGKSAKKGKSSRQSSEDGGNKLVLVGGILACVAVVGLMGWLLSGIFQKGPGGAPVGWREFSPPSGAFKLEVPGAAERQNARETAPAAECFSAEGQGFTCHVGHFPVAAGVEPGRANPHQVFTDCETALMQSIPGAVEKSNQSLMVPSSIGELPARDIHLSAPDGERDLRIVYTGRGAAALEFQYKGDLPKADRERFYKSLQIAEPVAPIIKQNAIARMHSRFVDRKKAVAENPNLVETTNRITASDPLSTAGQGFFAATSQLSVMTIQHNIEIMKVIEDRNPTFEEMDKMLKDNHIELKGLYSYQVYAYDAQTAIICVMEDPVEKERLKAEQ